MEGEGGTGHVRSPSGDSVGVSTGVTAAGSWAVHRSGDQGEDEDRHHPRADQCRRVVRPHGPGRQADLGQCDQQWQRRGGEQHQLDPLASGKSSAIDHQDGQTPHSEQEEEEDDEPIGRLADRLDVDVHAGGDEEDRDEEPVADRVELLLQSVYVARRPSTEHHAGEEGSQDDVETELAGQDQQAQEQE